jgi:hypothetical protein
LADRTPPPQGIQVQGFTTFKLTRVSFTFGIFSSIHKKYIKQLVLGTLRDKKVNKTSKSPSGGSSSWLPPIDHMLDARL